MQEPIRDLDIVALVEEIPTDGLPAGQTGTVVMTHGNGEAFEVEFILRPHHSIVATILRDKLLKLKGMDYPAVAI